MGVDLFCQSWLLECDYEIDRVRETREKRHFMVISIACFTVDCYFACLGRGTV